MHIPKRVKTPLVPSIPGIQLCPQFQKEPVGSITQTWCPPSRTCSISRGSDTYWSVLQAPVGRPSCWIRHSPSTYSHISGSKLIPCKCGFFCQPQPWASYTGFPSDQPNYNWLNQLFHGLSLPVWLYVGFLFCFVYFFESLEEGALGLGWCHHSFCSVHNFLSHVGGRFDFEKWRPFKFWLQKVVWLSSQQF